MITDNQVLTDHMVYTVHTYLGGTTLVQNNLAGGGGGMYIRVGQKIKILSKISAYPGYIVLVYYENNAKN